MRINEQGMREMAAFLAAHHKAGNSLTRDMIAAWAADAEEQMSQGNPASIEIRSHESISGRPVELYISEDGVSE